MKKEYPTYYEYFMAVYKVRIVWYSIFGTMALLLIRGLLSFNLAVYLIIQLPFLSFLIWALASFIPLVQLDFAGFCTFVGGQHIYAKLEADYQHAIKELPEGFVGKNYFIKKNPLVKSKYEPADFFVKLDDICWVYYQTVQHQFIGFRVKKTAELQVFAYDGSFALRLRKKDDFDFADYIEEQGVAFILGYSQEREAMYHAGPSKSAFIHNVVQAEQSVLQADSAGPIYNKPVQEVAIVGHKTLGEQFQAMREYLLDQVLLGRRRITTTEPQKQIPVPDDTQQLTLDLDTASYQILDETSTITTKRKTKKKPVVNPVHPTETTKGKEATVKTKQKVASESEDALAKTVEETDLAVKSASKTSDKQKQTTNGENI